MLRSLDELLLELEQSIESDAQRASYEANLGTATRVAAALPLVHRTGHERQVEPWHRILYGGMLRASDATEEERQCGWTRAAYFFLGSAAYPHGDIAFVLAPQATGGFAGSFSPFDSGALACG
ncbi:MAG: hypothetical protein JW751_18990 [Polyangiaceae bacterium]|nr:hypothetical protein [Polyangiaceae bacterium]